MGRFFQRLFSRNGYVLLLLTVVVFIAYANVIRGPMLFDDEHFIGKNVLIRSLSNIPDIYTTSVTQGAFTAGNFYRPNQQMVYALLYHFFGLTPAPYHLMSTLLHLFNAFLLFLLLSRLTFSRPAAFIASLFFLIHPVMTEAVSYISGLADPLGLFFMLLGLWLFTVSFQPAGKTRYLYFGLSVLFFILALFSKENYIILFPLAVLVVVFLYLDSRRRPDRFTVISLSIYLALVTGYLVLKFTVFTFTGSPGLTEENNIYTSHLYVRLLTFVNVLWDYVKMIIFPLRLNYEKPYMAYVSFLSWRALFGFLFIFITLFFTVRARRYPRLFLGLAWFFISLAPFTGIIPLNAMFLEHWLYVPMIGVAVLLATFFEWLAKYNRARILVYLLIPVTILYCYRIILRNREWSDIEKFYLNELKYTSSSVRIYNNLGMYYADKGDYAKTVYYYNEAIKTDDRYPQPHHNLANLYLEQGQYDKAVEELYRALKIDPNFIYSLSRLYEIYDETGHSDEAEKVYRLIQNDRNGIKNTYPEIESIRR